MLSATHSFGIDFDDEEEGLLIDYSLYLARTPSNPKPAMVKTTSC
jgi:hypothetical protein